MTKRDVRTSLPTRIAVAKALLMAEIGSPKDAAELVVSGGLDCREVSVDTCKKAFEFFRSLNEPTAMLVNDWMADVKARFPLVKDFHLCI